MSKLNYLIGVSINKLVIGLINSNYKALRFITNGTYFTLDLKRSGEHVNTIFDVGANIGQSCLSFTESFPNAQIYSFEPISDTYDNLKTNAQKYSSIHCVKSALGDEQKELEISLQPDPEANSLKVVIENIDSKVETITVDTGENFCRDNNIQSIDLLKIDTEGYELEVLKGFDDAFLKEKVKLFTPKLALGERIFLKPIMLI